MSAARDGGAPTLPAIDEALFAHFRRITGSHNRFQFATWLAETTRKVESQIRGWDFLTKRERFARLVEHLEAQQPARWPSLELIAGGLAE